MNDKDTSIPGTVAPDVQEMDVVLSKCHGGVITVGETELPSGFPLESA